MTTEPNIETRVRQIIDSIAHEGSPLNPKWIEGLTEEQADEIAHTLAEAGKSLLLQAGRLLELSKSL